MEIPKITSVETAERRNQAKAKAPGQPPAEKEEKSQAAAKAEESQRESDLAAAARELGDSLGLKVELVQDESTGRGVVRIFSEDGDRLLRQMPPDEVLRLAARAREGTLEGIVDSKV